MIDATLVTIHGIGSSAETWKRLNAVWSADEQLRGLLIDPFEYPSPKVPKSRFSRTRIPDYDDIAQSFANRYTVRYGKATRLAIVTHSQGGLILQRFLAWMLENGQGQDLSRICTIVMLACPNGGTEYLGSLRHLLGLRHHPQAENLEVLNKRITDTKRLVLRSIVNATGVDGHQCHIPFHVYAGASDNIVPAASAQDAFPGALVLPGDHSSILDPGAPGNSTAETVKHCILTDLAAGSAVPAESAAADPATGGAPPVAEAQVPPPTEAQAPSAAEAAPKYRIDIRNSQGVTIGDGSHVTQSFGVPSATPDAEGEGSGPQ
jgi:pimeloyl-ACP methyl ester carboxylesterase